MKIKSDGYSFFLVSKILGKFLGKKIRAVNFFDDGISFSTDDETIDAYLHPRFSWLAINSTHDLKKTCAYGWQEALKNGTILSSGQAGCDRVLYMDISTGADFGGTRTWKVWFEFFGGFPNVFLTKGEDGKIVRHFRKSFSAKRKLRSGEIYKLSFPEDPKPASLNEWLCKAQILAGLSREKIDIIEKSEISDASKISLVKFNGGEYAIPCINSEEFFQQRPSEIIEKFNKETQKSAIISPAQKEREKLKKAERTAMKSLKEILSPEEILSFGEKVKTSEERYLPFLEPEDPKLSEIYLKISGEAKGDIIKKLFSIYKKNLRKRNDLEKNIAQIRKELEDACFENLGETEKTQEDKTDPLARYRVFKSPTGKTVAVSKSAEDSDKLTMKIASQKDMFFHVKDAKGSHVILFLGNAKEAQKSDIEYAASIAACFSSARFSSLVPVQYTFRKYVRKPRKSPKGLVVLDREKVLFVSPKPHISGAGKPTA
ncbi:DUF814 domain-containing protein [candidate division WOR-3 bacterium]|nr:DUF814 domain-containing protein [candidate division WOR-3 bacterium]